jgi:hypothetical protein
MATVATRSLSERALEALRRAGNPFRNYFARNPDDEVCALYHVPELFARERQLLLSVVDLFRNTPGMHSEVVPVLGNKGSGKTHLLYSIKHGTDGPWQLLVTPGTYQRDTEFLEYLLFQVIDTLLGGGKQKNARPLEYVGDRLVRGLMIRALNALTPAQRLELFPPSGLGRWARRLGLGGGQAQERMQWLINQLSPPPTLPLQTSALRRACEESGVTMEQACDLVCKHIEKTESHNTAGLMRRSILMGFTRAVLLKDESDLASFLTYGFAELDFQVRPSRQDLVLALFKVLTGVLRDLRVPVVVAFDQLEDLLLARRSDDVHRTAEAFFAGIVQAMHHLDGISFLIFAERGLWNRFVPSLDGYIQDRLNNPVHLPEYGTINALRLEAPPAALVRCIVEARLRPALQSSPELADLSPLFPFTEDQIDRVARTEPTLRDMLQQFRHQFDHMIYGPGLTGPTGETATRLLQDPVLDLPPEVKAVSILQAPHSFDPTQVPSADQSMPMVLSAQDIAPEGEPGASAPGVGFAPVAGVPGSSEAPRLALPDLWDQEVRSARRKLEPEGALTGATRELQMGLAAFLQICHEHGVKVGPWRLSHVVGEWTFGDHPTYGVMTITHWVCRDGQPWKVGIGLFLGRGNAKPKDLGIKLTALEVEPAVVDYLILLRPEDDLALTGRSKSIWQEAERSGRHIRLEPVTLDAFAALYAFPRVVACLTESLPQGQPLPNLADLLQDKCEKLLEQVCMPTQG